MQFDIVWASSLRVLMGWSFLPVPPLSKVLKRHNAFKFAPANMTVLLFTKVCSQKCDMIFSSGATSFSNPFV